VVSVTRLYFVDMTALGVLVVVVADTTTILRVSVVVYRSVHVRE
jgi:hypothetical protein